MSALTRRVKTLKSNIEIDSFINKNNEKMIIIRLSKRSSRLHFICYKESLLVGHKLNDIVDISAEVGFFENKLVFIEGKESLPNEDIIKIKDIVAVNF